MSVTMLQKLLAAALMVALSASSWAAGSGAEFEKAQAELQRLESSTGLDEALKTQLVAAWRETTELLREQARFSDKAAEFEQLRREAPARLESLRSELTAPPPPPAELPPDTELAALEQALAQAQAQKATAEQAVEDLQAERRTRTDRRLGLPGEINRVQQQIDALSTAALPSGSDEPPSLAQARRARASARASALQAELLARQAELSSYEARSELLTVRQDLSVRRANEAAPQAARLAQAVNERRSREALSATREAEVARRELDRAPEVVRELARSNAELAVERRELVADSQRSAELVKGQLAEAERIETRRRSIERKVDAAQFTKPVALLMRRHQAELPDLGRHRARQRARQRTTSQQLARQLDVEDERAGLTDLEAAVAEKLAALSPPPEDEAARAEAAQTLKDLLTSRRQLLDDLYQEQGSYLTQLAEFDATEGRLLTATERYGSFIAEHLLWLRATPVVGPRDLPAAGRALGWIASPGAWRELVAALGAHAKERPFELFQLLVAGLLIFGRRLALGRLTGISIELGRSRRHRFAQTLKALGLTLAATAAWPLAVWWLSGFVASASETTLGLPLAAGLSRLARLLLPLFLLLDTFRPHGLAHAHFRWPAPLLEAVRRWKWLLGAVVVPAFVVDAVLDAQERPELRDSLGRLALIAGLIALGVFLIRTLDPGLRPAAARGRRLLIMQRLGALAPLLLAFAALLGYLFLARDFGARLLETYALLFAIAVAHAIAVRWLVVERRRLRLEELRKQGGSEAAAESALEGAIAADSMELDLEVVDTQTRQLLRAGVVVGIAVSVWLLWAQVLPAARGMDRVVLWQSGTQAQAQAQAAPAQPLLPGLPALGEQPGARAEENGVHAAETPPGAVTLLDVLLALALVGLTLFAAGNVPGLLDIAVLRRIELEPGSGYAISTLTRYAITIGGLVSAASLIGISWGSVQWLAAAVTVGLGFGLQEIFANFVSGLIILFEKPMRVGDIVTVGGVEGRVTRIRTRATTISDWDRRELLVPNREFITGQLINWTLTDPITRVVVPVGIAYGSDTRKATELLLAAARSNSNVLSDPQPSVVFKSFGESSLDFALRVFIPRRDVWPTLIHELHTTIDDSFRKAGIEIAFPQRDIHVRSVPAELTRDGGETG